MHTEHAGGDVADRTEQECHADLHQRLLGLAGVLGNEPEYDQNALGLVDRVGTDPPRIPLCLSSMNVAMQPNVSDYRYWLHHRLYYKALGKA
jgi:hypothetical protein